MKRNYILQKIPLVILDSTSSSSAGDNSTDEDTAVSPTPPALPIPPVIPTAPASPIPPASPVSPTYPTSPIFSRTNSPRYGPTASDHSDDRRPRYLGAPPIFPRNTHWMHRQVRKTTGLPPRRQLVQRDLPFSTHELGESSQQPDLRTQLLTVTTELEEATSVIRETRNSLRDATIVQGLVEQVAALEAGGQAWREIFENRIHDSTNLIERNYVEAMAPKCNKCSYHYLGPCPTCENCGRVGHYAKYRKELIRKQNQPLKIRRQPPSQRQQQQPQQQQQQRKPPQQQRQYNVRACFNYGSPDHYIRDCPNKREYSKE